MKRIRVIAYIPIILLVLIGCTTVPTTRKVPSSVIATVEMFKSSTVGEIVANCSIPVLFDRELLIREADIRRLIETLQTSSTRFSTVSSLVATSSSVLTPLFGDSFEVNTFLKNYAPESPILVNIDTDFGKLVLLVGEKSGSVHRILGVVTL